MWRAFVRDLSDEARYDRFMTRLSDLPEAMAERLTINENIGHPALVDEVFADANATRFGEARYIVDRAMLPRASLGGPESSSRGGEIMPRRSALVACTSTPLQRTRRSSRSPSPGVGCLQSQGEAGSCTSAGTCRPTISS
jgi:hypothetical protein